MAWICPALAPVIWFSSAAGTRTSTGETSSSASLIARVPGKPATDPVRFLCSTRSRTGIGRSLQMAPPVSDAARSAKPSAAISRAAMLPALPNPSTATVAWRGSSPRCAQARRATTATPRPVASLRPSLPPTESGLPVTAAGIEYPALIDMVSMIQAITWGVVLTSGAGMSRSGPISTEISAAYRRVSLSSSPRLSRLGSTTTPPLAPPKGIPAAAHFQVIHIASALTSLRVTPGWYLIPPLAGPRARLCWTR